MTVAELRKHLVPYGDDVVVYLESSTEVGHAVKVDSDCFDTDEGPAVVIVMEADDD